MTVDEIYTELSQVPFCARLPDAGLRCLADCAQPRSFDAGQVLFHEGTVSSDLFLMRRGRVQLQMRVPGRGSVPILTLGPGQLVGWSAAMHGGEMTTSAIALETTEVFALAGDTIRTLCEQDHELGFRFMQQLAGALARRLVATRLQLLDLFATDPPRIPVSEPPPQHV